MPGCTANSLHVKDVGHCGAPGSGLMFEGKGLEMGFGIQAIVWGVGCRVRFLGYGESTRRVSVDSEVARWRMVDHSADRAGGHPLESDGKTERQEKKYLTTYKMLKPTTCWMLQSGGPA